MSEWESSYKSGVKLPSSGYARVKVSPEKVTVEYVRVYNTKDEDVGVTSSTPNAKV